MTPHKQGQIVMLLGAMMALVPTLGYPNEELLQDTLKSILVGFFALSAALLFFWNLRSEKGTIHLHAVLLLPISLLAYAAGSAIWSHTYLGTVEALRWFVLALVLFLGLNTLSHARMTHLAWGIHIGAVMAALWAALQFWVDFSFFAQGRTPASTFVNRNFFGEFIVCTFPFSVLLLMRVRDKTSVFLLTFSLAFNIVALMMAGTRSALIGLMLLAPLLPWIVFRYRKQIFSTGWHRGHRLSLAALFACSIWSLGSIETSNSVLIEENAGRITALERAFTRTVALTRSREYSEGSFSVRAVMWKATGKMIQAHPLFGVGAGAWEVHVPLFQEDGKLLETDYYVHNEILQLVAEYGLVGWLFLANLIGYLCWAAYATLANKSQEAELEGPLRALTLASLLVFLVVSNAGFPWRMATTGALFALSLSILAASDIRLGVGQFHFPRAVALNANLQRWALAVTAVCTVLAMLIAQQAIECESKLVRAIKIALTIARSSAPQDAKWGPAKSDMLQLVREGIAINPHYRKLTPIVADTLAQWGDWENATWIWKSVLESRPYVGALLTNAARGEIQARNFSQAAQYIQRAKAIQPQSPSLRTLEVLFLARTGQEQEAALRARQLVEENVTDLDLIRAAYTLGLRTHDPQLAIAAMELRIRTWPEQAVDGWLKLGEIYETPNALNTDKALQSYQAAYDAANPNQKAAVLALIAQNYRSRIK